MALRNQPYFPLYVADYSGDEKLIQCSASSQGVYIRLLCLFHKSDEYGGILLKQKNKQNESNIENFVQLLSKILPFDFNTVADAIVELIDEKVLHIEGDFLFQKRMVKDNKISIARSEAGKLGGGNPDLNKQKSKQTPKQKNKQIPKQKPEYEYDTEFEFVYDIYNKKIGDKNKLKIKWNNLTLEEKEKAKEHIPKYVQSTPDKKFRKNLDTYLNNKSFNDEIIQNNGKNNGLAADRDDDSIFDKPSDYLHSN
jgi:hypothetical protein